ncbi:MAG: hypothetical protein JWO97_1886 [Acidobacteria bacterium]|nr:hypothetical protein [Acidobacteriota bacterium]
MKMLVAVALFAATATAQSITMPISRDFPAEAPLSADMKHTDERPVPVRVSGCGDAVQLRELRYGLKVVKTGDDLFNADITIDATIEKSTKGPFAAPLLTIAFTSTMPPVDVSFEPAMEAAQWENGGTFHVVETHTMRDVADAKFWRSAELRCVATSPFRPAVIPKDVTYKPGPDKTLNDVAAHLRATLSGAQRFGTLSLYGDDPMIFVGPILYAAVQHDADLAKVESPAMRAIDPASGKARAQLRVKGEKEIALFANAMHRYLGDTTPRIRAATSRELAAHWLNIGWDIEEPLLVADYGAHRLVFDYHEAHVLMIDELPPPASVLER